MGSMVLLHIFEQCKRLIVLIVGDKHVNHLSIELPTGYKALLARDVFPELPSHVDLTALATGSEVNRVGVQAPLH